MESAALFGNISLHIFRKATRKFHSFQALRMEKRKEVGMKILTRFIQDLFAITRIIQDGMADILHMDSDLVCSAGMQRTFHIRKAFKLL